MYRIFRACALALCLAGNALATPAATQGIAEIQPIYSVFWVMVSFITCGSQKVIP